MKKILALVLILALVFSFAACGKKEPTFTPSTESVSSTENVVSTEEGNSTNDAINFTRGTVSNNTYESEVLGLGVALGSDWLFLTDEEIAALYGITSTLMGDDFEEYLKTATVIYDMHAINGTTSASLGINFEKLSILGEAQTANMEVTVASLMPTVAYSLESVGATDIEYELHEFTIGSETFYGAKITGNLSGLDIYEAIICVKCDGYLACITIATYLEDATQEVVDSFYVLK